MTARPAKKKDAKPAPPRKKGSWLATLRSFVIALALAFLVRVFIFEIFKIPSCSMEPTLEGVSLSIGDRVGVNKLAYAFSDVRRYDVIVFEHTDIRGSRRVTRDYIKRVAGLPGEDISIVAGDLYVNGRIAPKPPAVQDSVWMPVCFEDFEDGEWRRFWEPRSGNWRITGGMLRGDGVLRYLHWEKVFRNGVLESTPITNLYPRLSILKEVYSPKTGERFTPRYQDCYVEEDRATGRFERGFISPRSLARIPYEGAPDDRSQPLKAPLTTGFWLGGKSCVGDLRVSFLVKPVVASGRLVVTIERQGELPGVPGTHSLVLPFSEAGKPLYRSPLGSDVLPAECRLAPDRAVRVEFALWDGVVMVRLDGKTVFRKSYEPSGRELRGNSITLSLEGGAVADFDDIAIDKDIYYITVDAGSINPWQTAPGRYHVPEGRYFVLGDNSPASSDCRYKMPPVPRDAIIGRAFAVIWPVRHWKFLPRGAK